jgi:hypothetical protein
MQGLTKPAKVIPWSYSSLTKFENCPRQWYLLNTKQAQDAMGAEAMEGVKAHKAFENAVNDRERLPAHYQHYQPIVDRIKATPGQKLPENKWGLTASLKPTTFFAKDVWARGVIDLTVLPGGDRAVLIDYKTGKVKDDSSQLELFAGVAFAQYPYVQTVETAYLWVNKNKLTREKFSREGVPMIWQGFAGRVRRMEHALESDNFPPRPSGLCQKYCPVGRALCEFCGS